MGSLDSETRSGDSVYMTLVIRHSLSEANNRENIGTPAFASAEAPLMAEGCLLATELGATLRHTYDVDMLQARAAVSTMRRTRETAVSAGYLPEHLVMYPILDEVPRMREFAELRAMLDAGVVPPEAIEAAYRLLEQPPQEEVWFTHGLVIAGLCRVLNTHQDRRVVPRFCEIRELTIPR